MHSLLKSRAASCPDCTLAMLLEPWPWARRSRSSGSTPSPFSSGCRSHSSVDVIHAGKEPQGAWLHSQSKVSLSPAAAGKGELLVARLLWGFKNLSQKGDTAYSALIRIFTQRLVDFFRVPGHELPHPCNRTRLSVPQGTPRIAPESTCLAESSQCNGQIAMMSHMSYS
jgi:hypothetical protein